MRILALASQTGGSGKTTLAAHLAVQAERAGAGPVVLTDIDPHGTLASWWNMRDVESPAFAQTTVARLAADTEMLRMQGFRLAIIDTPPLASTAVAGVIALAELVVVPTRPTAGDLRVATGTVDLCARAGKPLLFVMNGAGTAMAPSETMMQLAQHGAVAPYAIPDAASLADAMLAGETAIEREPDGDASRAFAGLWSYVAGRLEKNFRRTVFAVPPRAATGGFGRRGL